MKSNQERMLELLEGIVYKYWFDLGRWHQKYNGNFYKSDDFVFGEKYKNQLRKDYEAGILFEQLCQWTNGGK